MVKLPQRNMEPPDTIDHAQCIKCGEWKHTDDMSSFDMVPCLVYGQIPQGICHDCTGENE